MTPETPQDREDRITQRILAIGAMVLCGIIIIILLTREIPSKNEILLGTVVGFIFGNMVGPVYRKVFGGPDVGTRQAVTASNEVLKTAVMAASNSSPNKTDLMNVQADQVSVTEEPKK